MSDALVWHLIRDNNCFLHKRGTTSRDGDVQFSSEPGNLMNVNTFKYSGIANANAIDVSMKGSRVVMTHKNAQKLNKPNTSKKSVKGSKFAADKVYRRDLASTVAARVKKLQGVSKMRGAKAHKALIIKSARNTKRRLVK